MDDKIVPAVMVAVEMGWRGHEIGMTLAQTLATARDGEMNLDGEMKTTSDLFFDPTGGLKSIKGGDKSLLPLRVSR